MRKVIIILIAVILLIGVSGCESVTAAHEEISLTDIANACNIMTAINTHNEFYLKSVLNSNTTLEDAKQHIGKYQWPTGLSYDEEKAAWKLIAIKDGVADLIPEAKEVLQDPARDAYYIVNAINAYHALNPSEITNFNSLEVTKNHINEYLWPAGLSDEEESAAWKLIVIDYGYMRADLTPEAQQALQEGSEGESDQVRIMNAGMITTGINAYNALNPYEILPENASLAEVKEALEIIRLWPLYLTDIEASEAWKLIEIKDGVATVKRES